MGVVSIAGINFNTSYALKELDPIAYRCGLSDYVSELDVSDNSKYQELQEQLEAKQEKLDELTDKKLSKYLYRDNPLYYPKQLFFENLDINIPGGYLCPNFG